MNKTEIIKNKLDKLVDDGIVVKWISDNDFEDSALVFINDWNWSDFKNRVIDFIDLEDVNKSNAYVKNHYIVLILNIYEDFNLQGGKMLITEFAKELKKLSHDYKCAVAKDTNKCYVVYKNKIVLTIFSRKFALKRSVLSNEFERLPFSHKLWMLASELAMTPYNERFKQNKYNVIIGNDEPFAPYTAWSFSQEGNYLINYANSMILQKDDGFQFTDSEFKDLIKYIKTLPDGEFQAKAAEHGKRLVEDK